MSASFSIASADVVVTRDGEPVDGPKLEGVQITVRNGRGRLTTDRSGAIEPVEQTQRADVVLAVRLSRKAWRVTFTDGTVWDVTRSAKGCRRCG